jgi:hypothetical protein
MTRRLFCVLGYSRHGSFGSIARPLAFHEAVDVVGLVAWLHKDAQIKRLDAEIDSEADDGAALSHEDFFLLIGVVVFAAGAGPPGGRRGRARARRGRVRLIEQDRVQPIIADGALRFARETDAGAPAARRRGAGRLAGDRAQGEHRAEISPVALLGLRPVTTARVNQTPGTTPGYSWPMRR